MKIIIRELELNDLQDYEYWMQPTRKFHQFNGPYYKQRTTTELSEYVNELKKQLLDGKKNILENKRMIVDSKNNDLIGQVNWYWKSKETNWLEVGVVIFNENYWGRGIGYKALKKWINIVFDEFPQIVRIGLTTWSGNERMMKLAEKLGLKKESTYRNARIVDGEYYDSVSYGALKSEWFNAQEL